MIKLFLLAMSWNIFVTKPVFFLSYWTKLPLCDRKDQIIGEIRPMNISFLCQYVSSVYFVTKYLKYSFEDAALDQR